MNDRDSERNDNPRDSNRSERPQGSRRDASEQRKPRREGEYRKPRRDGDSSGYDRRPRRDGDDQSHRPRREGANGGYDRKPRREGESSGYDRKPRREGERSGYDRRPQRDGERSYDRRPRRDGDSQDRRPRRDGDRPYEARPRREGDRPYESRPRRENDRPSDGKRREGEGGGYDRRPRREGDGAGENRRPRGEGERSRSERGSWDRKDGDRNQLGRGGTRGGGRSDRGGRGREFTEAERLQHELRPVRSEHDDPVLPDDVTPFDLHPGARNELKTLQPETAEWVARHLAMVAGLIDTDPELAHQHAISASRRGGRIPVARETLAVTAYHIGDYALALRELRTYRRLTGSQGHLALMVECERALGRPERGIETGLAANLSELNTEQRVQLAIAMSGARLDLGQTQQALFELEIPELDPNKAFGWSPELFAAYATVLEDLGRESESKQWRRRALVAQEAINEQLGGHDQLEVLEVYEHAPSFDERRESAAPSDAASTDEPEAEADVPGEAESEVQVEAEPAGEEGTA